jgi:hypothetical protein
MYDKNSQVPTRSKLGPCSRDEALALSLIHPLRVKAPHEAGRCGSKRNSLNGNGHWAKTQCMAHLAQCTRGLPLAQPQHRYPSLARPSVMMSAQVWFKRVCRARTVHDDPNGARVEQALWCGSRWPTLA